MAKIVGIQFSILSPEEIRNGSVAAITSRDTYVNNKPVIGGLFDPRMGVLEPGYVCPTDGLDYIKTPGYFGHINLAKPVFYVQYLNTVIKILRCTCFKCSKLLINKENYQHALQMNSEDRWNFVFGLASKVKRCGDDTCDGCGCKQPSKIRKEGLATLTAVWDKMDGVDSDELSMTITPEMVIKQFRRISDEDVAFMGFSPVWSRPDWMVCQVLAVPPPAVRPSVKHDSQQRSEDDLTHIIVNIIKANKMLQEKMDGNANEHIINDWALLLQYHVSTLVDNDIPGVAVAAQRSGRPLKAVKGRLNGKGGRIRGNLMGKRVDFSARSVITPDPNLSITELGVPKKVAMNLTSPVCVNERNLAFLTKLVQNGPDEYPGAKMLVRKNGDNISLRYVDRKSIQLKPGDVVHRHMMDGDPVLFNRQPTLHRMSMMCHRTKVMPRGDTFRMNVACTKPYNADFDGDEMNMHMPQSVRSSSELMNLAAVPWQIISPANNKPIIGIFQDSLLGAHRITRPDIQFTPREAMNLLMAFDKVDVSKLNGKGVKSFDILSQIMPPLSLKYKTKRFGDDEDYDTSNNVLDIQNGAFARGQLEKGVLGDGTKGLLKRITSDFGNTSATQFIDNLQNIVTEYMKTSCYSVGISDLIADAKTNDSISEIITAKKREVRTLIDQTHLGIFENKTGKTDEEEFETQINNILNRASNEAGKLGRQSLDKDNRFVIMVNAGSKGSELNISQMISCLGQQNVDGKRIPYGFENRTLPHFNKFDDSPAARGFVENSFISGLSPTELFFHAMGGRVGLIDTAVKTSQTGYIQRRLIKGLEDLKTEYDMTVRNNKGKIIQFAYGDDGIDPTHVESQAFPLINMSIKDVYDRFYVPTDKAPYTKAAMERMSKQKDDLAAKTKSLIEEMNTQRKVIIEQVFGMRENNKVHVPVGFQFLIDNVQGQQFINVNSLVDITPMEAYEMIEEGLDRLKTLYYAPPSKLFETIYRFHMAPAILLNKKRFHRKALGVLIERIVHQYKKSVVAPGEMVGLVAAQSIGEPTTQMSLHADERIRLIKRPRGTQTCEAITVTIGEFCDAIIQENPHLTLPTGHHDSVETLLEGDEYFVVGVDGIEKTGWNPISHVSKHPVNGEMMKVTTRSGRTVRTTTSHSHLVRRNQTVEPIIGSDMKVGMRIPVCKRLKTPFECACEPLMEIAEDESIDRIDGLYELVEACANKMGVFQNAMNIGDSMSRSSLKQLIEFIEGYNKDIIPKEFAILKQAADADVVWDEVVDIEIYTPDQSEYVYDFTVPNTQTFMVENGVIVHNTLNTFHFAGVASKSNVTRGVPRIEEIMSLSENPKNPSCTVYLHQSEETELENAEKTMHLLERTRLRDVVDSVQICFDPDDGSTNLSEDADMLRDFHEFEQMVNGCLEQTDPTTDEKSKWVIRIEMSVENMLDRNITMDDVNFAIKNAYQDDVECAFSDYNDDALVFRIRLASALDRTKKLEKPHPLDQSDEICLLKKFQDKLLDDLILRGVKNIGRVIPRKVTDSLHEEDGKYVKKESWVLDTVGTNLLDILSLEEIDTVRTFTNDIQEIHRTLGIEAARQAIFNEISDVIEFDSTYINYHHLSVLCDRMTCKDSMVSIFRHGINNDDIGPIAKASFEETPEMFLKAARHAELDSMRGVSANVMCGQEGYFGTSAFQVMLDLDKRAEMNTTQWSAEEEVDDAFIKMTESIAGPCADIAIQSNVQHTRAQDIGAADEAYGLDF